ncbi:hypothetical protein PFISCL1PPCAC_12630 [Pristionchus fissidentatus]|uniref:G protein-coupled receptor n=1 Tax=Pristionchus fissidentatus TaxID=1538716 RepID=A0AAV5VPF4_9BILA|nr:hypothetical protein PFISCL1PPCAC_12630 [Pristionchus fissidentatus]
MCVINLLATELPTAKTEPLARSYLIDLSTCTQMYCEALEILIAAERILSAVRPAAYYKSIMSWPMRMLLIVVLLCFATLQGWLTEDDLIN